MERSGIPVQCSALLGMIIHSYTELGFDQLLNPQARHTHHESHVQSLPENSYLPLSLKPDESLV